MRATLFAIIFSLLSSPVFANPQSCSIANPHNCATEADIISEIIPNSQKIENIKITKKAAAYKNSQQKKERPGHAAFENTIIVLK